MANIPFLNNTSFSAKVAIGTETSYTVGGVAQLTIATESAETALAFGPSNNDMFYMRSAGSQGDFQFQTSVNSGNSGSIQLQPFGGNVGIGTTSPGSILELAGATPILTLNSTAVNVAQGIEWRNSGTLDAYIKQGPSSAEFEFNVGRNTTWGGDFKFVTDTYDAYRITRDQHTFYTLGSERMRIDSSGNILVNKTSSTGDVFQVQGKDQVFASRLDGSTTTGQSYGLRVRAGTNSVDTSMLVENTSGTDLFQIKGTGNATFTGLVLVSHQSLQLTL